MLRRNTKSFKADTEHAHRRDLLLKVAVFQLF
jgi:hypothetical protein